MGHQRIIAVAVEIKMEHETSEVRRNDCMKALCIIFLSPLVFACVLVDAIQQTCRYLFSICGVCDMPQKGFVTEAASLYLQHAMEVSETSVLTESIIVGVLYFLKHAMVSVGVIVFITWLVDLISLWDPMSTMLRLCMVGIVLLLLLPVLGMSFYLASVVLLSLVVQDLGMGADAFWRDLVIAAVLGMVIKSFAVAWQQNGTPFSEDVAVMKTIGVKTWISTSTSRCWLAPSIVSSHLPVVVPETSTARVGFAVEDSCLHQPWRLVVAFCA